MTQDEVQRCQLMKLSASTYNLCIELITELEGSFSEMSDRYRDILITEIGKEIVEINSIVSNPMRTSKISTENPTDTFGNALFKLSKLFAF